MKHTIALLLAACSTPCLAGPSFDCERATYSVEFMICDNHVLSDLDEQIARSYELLLASTDSEIALRQGQRQWLSDIRNACQDVDCLEHAMTARLVQLSSATGVDFVEAETQDEALPQLTSAESMPVAEPIHGGPSPTQSSVEVAPKQPVSDITGVGLSSETQLALAAGGFAILVATVVGLSGYARYFLNWFDFVISLAGIVAGVIYISDAVYLLATVVLVNFLVGLLINRFDPIKGGVAAIGRCTAIFTLLALALACLVFVFAQKRTSNVGLRVRSGENIHQAILNDKRDQHREAMSVAGSLGAISVVLYWINAYFIDNAKRVADC